jgi:hypothetical protein
MTTVYKTTVHYPSTKPTTDDNSPLGEFYRRIHHLTAKLVNGPDSAAEVQDLGPDGFTTSRYWVDSEAAQMFIDCVNETMVDYEKTTTITEEVV